MSDQAKNLAFDNRIDEFLELAEGRSPWPVVKNKDAQNPLVDEAWSWLRRQRRTIIPSPGDRADRVVAKLFRLSKAPPVLLDYIATHLMAIADSNTPFEFESDISPEEWQRISLVAAIRDGVDAVLAYLDARRSGTHHCS